MIRISKFYGKVVNIASLIAAAAFSVFAQTSPGRTSPKSDDSFLGAYGVFIGIFAVAAIGIAAIVVLRKRTSGNNDNVPQILGRNGSMAPKPDELRIAYRQNKKIEQPQVGMAEISEPNMFDPNAAFLKLPINSFVRLQRTTPFLRLPDSEDDALLCAIEQTQEESDEDAEIRSLSLKILSAFRTGNSIAAISQIALYDLSSKLRSSAVSILADLDHESVFEAIVTACADPTREVRAAAARSLFRVNFDRAQAWTRIIETNDESRMRQAARAAMEGDLVERSFERLIHKDKNIAYEAYALTALLIKAGETEPVYRTLAEHKNENVKLALLHVLRTIKDERTFQALSDLLIHHELTPNVVVKINEVRSYSQLMNV